MMHSPAPLAGALRVDDPVCQLPSGEERRDNERLQWASEGRSVFANHDRADCRRGSEMKKDGERWSLVGQSDRRRRGESCGTEVYGTARGSRLGRG